MHYDFTGKLLSYELYCNFLKNKTMFEEQNILQNSQNLFYPSSTPLQRSSVSVFSGREALDTPEIQSVRDVLWGTKPKRRLVSHV